MASGWGSGRASRTVLVAVLLGSASWSACSIANKPLGVVKPFEDDFGGGGEDPTGGSNGGSGAGSTVPGCGNAELDEGEACDDGNEVETDGCSSDCEKSFCGDGVVWAGEETCDDGNGDIDDACPDGEDGNCLAAVCGDGFVQADVEDCDDQNEDDTDACIGCVAASCGDGIVQAGVEACDDGNGSNTDACPDGDGGSCEDAICGDGFVQAGAESCEDGNGDNTDACPDGPGGMCKTAACGDGFLQTSVESCPDFATCPYCSCGVGWALSGGWAVYNEAPLSDTAAVVFPGPVFGTDGNRAPPYPGAEVESSNVVSPPILIPASLTFESWHVDEGGSFYDTKKIEVSVDGGVTWTSLVDCSLGAVQPFCSGTSSTRTADQWDAINIPTATLAGQTGIVRISYNTIDSCCGFEKGWFIRNANFFAACP